MNCTTCSKSKVDSCLVLLQVKWDDPDPFITFRTPFELQGQCVTVKLVNDTSVELEFARRVNKFSEVKVPIPENSCSISITVTSKCRKQWHGEFLNESFACVPLATGSPISLGSDSFLFCNGSTLLKSEFATTNDLLCDDVFVFCNQLDDEARFGTIVQSTVPLLPFAKLLHCDEQNNNALDTVHVAFESLECPIATAPLQVGDALMVCSTVLEHAVSQSLCTNVVNLKADDELVICTASDAILSRAPIGSVVPWQALDKLFAYKTSTGSNVSRVFIEQPLPDDPPAGLVIAFESFLVCDTNGNLTTRPVPSSNATVLDGELVVTTFSDGGFHRDMLLAPWPILPPRFPRHTVSAADAGGFLISGNTTAKIPYATLQFEAEAGLFVASEYIAPETGIYEITTTVTVQVNAMGIEEFFTWISIPENVPAFAAVPVNQTVMKTQLHAYRTIAGIGAFDVMDDRNYFTPVVGSFPTFSYTQVYQQEIHQLVELLFGEHVFIRLQNDDSGQVVVTPSSTSARCLTIRMVGV